MSRVTFYCIGALVYNANFARFSDLVGITDKIDWSIDKKIEENELKDVINMSGKLLTQLAGWIFRSKKKKLKNPTFFISEF